MINERVCVDCPGRLRLVPYLPYHVPRYHAWMCDPALLAATESEPLSLDEERENQDAWLHSSEKLTFILTVPTSSLASSTEDARDRQWREVDTTVAAYSRAPGDAPAAEKVRYDDAASLPLSFTAEQVLDAFTMAPAVDQSLLDGAAEQGFVMAGDCNLFLLDADEINGVALGADAAPPAAAPCRVFEVEVMIAETALRRRGLAELAVRMLMQYAVAVLGATHFVAKILDDNESSIRLFEDKLRFREYKRVRVFHEVHLLRRLLTAEEKRGWRVECASPFFIAPFTPDMRRGTMSL